MISHTLILLMRKMMQTIKEMTLKFIGKIRKTRFHEILSSCFTNSFSVKQLENLREVFIYWSWKYWLAALIFLLSNWLF